MNNKSALDPVISYYVSSYINMLRKHIPISKSTKILEIGCGIGQFTYHLQKISSVVGIDNDINMIRQNPVQTVQFMDCLDLQFDDNSFDIVLCHDVLHHVADIDLAISEMSRVARSYLIIIEPNPRNIINFVSALLIKEERGLLKLSYSYWKSLLKKHNLSITTYFSFGIPAPNFFPAYLLPNLKKQQIKSCFGWDNFIIVKKN